METVKIPINQSPRVGNSSPITKDMFFDPRGSNNIELDIKVTVGGTIDGFVIGVWRWNEEQQKAFRVNTTTLLIFSAAGELQPAPDIVRAGGLGEILSYGDNVNIAGWFHDGEKDKGRRWFINSEYEFIDNNSIRLLPQNYKLNLVEGQRFHISPAEITFVQEIKTNNRLTCVTLEEVKGSFIKNIHSFSIEVYGTLL
ncbi:MAG: hypothetical protein AB1782_01445 [Cyanobacteriota bacterium]